MSTWQHVGLREERGGRDMQVGSSAGPSFGGHAWCLGWAGAAALLTNTGISCFHALQTRVESSAPWHWFLALAWH